MRTPKCKSQKGTTPLHTLREAAQLVRDNNQSVRSVAKELHICHVTLNRFIKKQERDGLDCVPAIRYGHNRQVFSDDEEGKLTDYIKDAASIYFGLTPKDVRKLAFEWAMSHKISVPQTWKDNEMAGNDWFSSFLKRNPTISVRTPEATSIARAMCFNKPYVEHFFSKLTDVMDRYKLEPNDIWNMDETGVTPVLKPSQIVASKGSKQVGAVTSAERGVLVTVAVAVNAIGNSVPPMFIFPRVKFYAHFIRDGPPGCIGTSNKSGWMMNEGFSMFVRHLIKHTKPTKDHKILLLLDNHSSHLSLEAISIAKDNGIIMLSFPPHCSHKLQPLDVSVYGPFKKFLRCAQDLWLRNHAGNPMSIYDIPGLVAEALPKALTPANITSGFRACGISPLNNAVFADHEFSPCLPTDRPMESVQNQAATSSG